MEATDHDIVVRRSFDRQTPLFTGTVFAAPSPAAPTWLEPLTPDLLVLDVACGAGHLAEQAAPFVRQIVGVDLTPSLLGLAADRLRAADVTNVLLQEGNAAALPFVDDSFDLVCCRAALHHFADPRGPLAEMARVCRPGGRVAISDVVAPDPTVRDAYDTLHRLLDPSHVRALLRTELTTLVTGTVGPLVHEEVTGRGALPLAAILTDVADRPAVRRTLDAELAGGPATGFAPSVVDGALHVSFTTVGLQATAV